MWVKPQKRVVDGTVGGEDSDETERFQPVHEPGVCEITDPETHTVEDSYFDTGKQVTEHEEMAVDQVTYRRTVSEVHNGLLGAGFDVTEMQELGTDDPGAYDGGPWEFQPDHMALVPAVLVVDARKPPS